MRERERKRENEREREAITVKRKKRWQQADEMTSCNTGTVYEYHWRKASIGLLCIRGNRKWRKIQ